MFLILKLLVPDDPPHSESGEDQNSSEESEDIRGAQRRLSGRPDGARPGGAFGVNSAGKMPSDFAHTLAGVPGLLGAYSLADSCISLVSRLSDSKHTFAGHAVGLKLVVDIEGTDELLMGKSISESTAEDLSN